jgi:hypothetical protein
VSAGFGEASASAIPNRQTYLTMCTIGFMRALLVTSIGVAAAGALLLPLAPTGSSVHTRSHHPARFSAAPADDAPPPGTHDTAEDRPAAQLPGHTQSLPLNAPRGAAHAGERLLSAWQDDPSGGKSAETRGVRRFSLVGVVWDDARAVPRGQLQVRTRASGTKRWSRWKRLDTHSGDGPDRDAASEKGRKPLGATDPLWTGDCDAVRVRIIPEAGRAGANAGADATNGSAGRAARVLNGLPKGARLELVDPGPEQPRSGAEADRPRTDPETKPRTKPESEAGHTVADQPATASEKRPGGTLPALSLAETRRTYGNWAHTPSSGATRSHIGPRPFIVTRRGWGANEALRQGQAPYTGTVKAVFIHHTAETNDYSCSQSPAIIRGIYRYHVQSSHWRDIGYNFLVDKCGKIYEGRAGGVARPVMGAHTFGFNANTSGIAVLGSYAEAEPSAAVTTALARLSAWKLGIGGISPTSKVSLFSGGGTKYPKGRTATFNAVSGHRDGYVTGCPGEALYRELGSIRSQAARIQGR